MQLVHQGIAPIPLESQQILFCHRKSLQSLVFVFRPVEDCDLRACKAQIFETRSERAAQGKIKGLRGQCPILSCVINL